MPQLEHIEAIEKRLWSAADNLRANSSYASNEYFLPVMGLVFLRHAFSRYQAVKAKIEPNLPSRGGKTRALTKEDFSQQSAIFLRPKAQFDHLVALPDSTDRARAIIEAMDSIEADYENLRGVLPKGEYQELDNQVLGQLLRTLNPDELKKVSGDAFGRIYEYFLTQFADQKAHDGGEFFTPVSLVSLIAHVLDPERGTVLDPAGGSGGMFVQSARIVEEHGQNPTERLTFRGLEKNATTIRLAKMNLAVHGLEGDIQKAITYYEDPHELVGRADYVMANPPFNVDEIDADKVKRDPRLPFGLPGVNKKEKEGWGAKIIDRLSHDLRAAFPDMKGLSPRNLKYMRKFADSWPDRAIVQEALARITWYHNLALLEKYENPEIRLWYARKTVEYGWSRNILAIQIESRLHQRQGKAVTNFNQAMPPVDSDMAAQVFKDPYLFDFLGTADPRKEREVEQALVDHIQKFLLEMGTGFAFVGKQVLLEVGDQDFYLDLLFYHLKLRCFVVVELKAVPFDPGFVGKLNLYLSAVDDLLLHPDDKPTIGLLLCKSKNKLVVEYALRGFNSPMGVAEWETRLTEFLPDELKSSLPSIEEIEAELGNEV